MRKQISALLSHFQTTWFWKYILFPFLASRLGLILVAWFGQYYAANPGSEKYITQGYFLSPHFLIDIWSRWDAEWYLSIVKNGYAPFLSSPDTANNVAFFPLYPLLVRLLTFLAPLKDSAISLYLAVGILLSSLFFLGAAYLLYKMILELFQNEGLAQRTVLLMIAFPAGFFFSTFYPESLFLLLSVALFYTALHKRWLLAACLAGLAALTRPQGIFLLLPLFWMYMEARSWKIKAIRIDFLALFLPLLFLGGYMVYLYSLTGDPLAILHAEAGWGRMAGNPVASLVDQFSSRYHFVFKIDAVLCLVFLAGAVYWVAARKPAGQPVSKAFGLYALVLVVFPILTGVWLSLSRFLVVVFPVFILLAWVGGGERFANRRRELYILLLVLFFIIQVLYFAGWTNYYFVA